MTLIAPGNAPSKKVFKELVAYDPDSVLLVNPAASYFATEPGPVLTAREAAAHDMTVTNHPKRSWFARIYMKNGKVVVA